MPEQQPRQSSSKEGSSSAGNNPPSRNRVATDGWGSRQEFQHSYLLGTDPGSIEKGNEILDGFIKHDIVHGNAGKK
ncbi:hypothetical protein DER45DRAFT_576984 [Fusarium avenaceum]|nr:hypothetical protein DER45DRAFT_576984 [Fusarium avenaceum]